MSDHLRWKNWANELSKHNHKPRKNLERWGLRYLHDTSSLNYLTKEIASWLSKLPLATSIPFSVQTESIWIDGTPQAVSTLIDKRNVQCELSDLLFIIEVKGRKGFFLEKAVLLQGKISCKHNKFSGSNQSTIKERKLLEKTNTHDCIDLYTGTSGVKSTHIGKYILGSSLNGMEEFSRYLLISKSNGWSGGKNFSHGPFQIGWPDSYTDSYLGKTHDFSFAVLRMLCSSGMGKLLNMSPACEWTRMVNDLRRQYKNITMNGYGGQSRINLSNNATFTTSKKITVANGKININNTPKILQLDIPQPLISIITLTINILPED